jgi:meiotic recombination protein SPO11
MLERIVDSLLEESKPLTITLKSRAGISRRCGKTGDSGGKVPEAKQRDINFPGSTAQEAWNFSLWPRYLVK